MCINRRLPNEYSRKVGEAVGDIEGTLLGEDVGGGEGAFPFIVGANVVLGCIVGI